MTQKPADRVRQYLQHSLTAYEESGSRAPRTAAEAFAALGAEDFSAGPGWLRVQRLVRFLAVPETREVLRRELRSPEPDRSFHAALLLALLGAADGLKVLEAPPTLSASGIEIGLALLARAALGKLGARELEAGLDRAPNARAFGL
ncbi:hypothetical protein [Haliangium sp. UPWRP_2]|uniref:hypothetical protein n=1 Tax=Haliangium sp. UPWRP_2 TaxID=1931276 RepID=UPI000D0D74ED|nr:hypothetical protein [Haliangium sp. UPWRP_2]PSM30640.1 hypothetical protein BVG81_009475 [Haliangium sp. UPWRP_2]